MNRIRQLIWPASEETMPAWISGFLQDMLSRSKYSQLIFYQSLNHRLPVRNWFAQKYLRGRGAEIGAQQVPTKVSNGCQVEYLDVISNEKLISRYGLPAADLVPLTHIIDGHDLGVYDDGELDFLIANHVLEHFDDPVGGAIEWLRVIKPGGHLFITLPNFRSNSYDFRRMPARAPHLEEDYFDPSGRPARNFKHYEDFAQTLYQYSDGDPRIKQQAQFWTDSDDRHHYHVYDRRTVEAVFSLSAKISTTGLRFVDGLLSNDGFEFLIILEKARTGASLTWPSPLTSRLTSSYRLLLKPAIQMWRKRKRFPLKT